MTNKIIAAVAFSLLAFGFSDSTARGEQQTVIRNVNVVDVVAGKILEGRDVFIAGGKIAAVHPTGGTQAAADAVRIDGADKYLLPGLFDSHVHYVSPETYGALMIAHGVTFVREMGNDTTTAIRLRDSLNSGEQLGPEMIACGAIVDGDPPIWPFSEACDSPEAARAAVRKLADAGVDQIKVYAMLKPQVHKAAVEEAIALGLKPVGHVPMGMRLEDAIAHGQVCFEHLDGFDEVIARAADEPIELPRSFHKGFLSWSLYSKADPAKLTALYELLREREIVICPTMVVIRGIGQATAQGDGSPWLEYVPGYLRSMWTGENYAKAAPGARRIVPLMQKVVAGLHSAGVTLLCGTDLANPFVYAGIALHDEMVLFQEAGIPPTDVLRSATITPAKFFGVADRLGSIEPGKAASLVLVNANPLEDVANARQIEGVFLRGKHYDRAAIDELLAEAKTAVQGADTTDAAAAADADLPPLPGDVIHRGTYVSKFGQWDAGTETFVITRDDDGYHVRTQIQPKGGPTQPSRGTFHYSNDFKLREAVWEQLSGAKGATTYTVSDGKIVARHVAGTAEPQEQTVELPAEWQFGGPFYACEFANNKLTTLDVGQTKTVSTLGFGYPDWRVLPNEIKVTRHQDRPLDAPTNSGGADAADASAPNSPLHYYASTFNTPMGEFNGEAWISADGLVLKSILKMPFGVVTATYEESE